jgi:hypothetical protein
MVTGAFGRKRRSWSLWCDLGGADLKAAVQFTPSQVDAALADSLFSEAQAGRPVYAMPDDESLTLFAEQFGIPPKEARWLIRRAAAIQIGLGDDRSKPFAKVSGRLKEGSTSPLDTPAGLSTLATLSMAADAMHAEEGMAAHNYYGRLHALLGTQESQKVAVERGYRDHGETLWDALNSWLEAWEGERGIPTAYVVGTMQYVGLALSQALVRRGDRDKLPALFVDEGLPPGYRLSPSDMEATLDGWMPRQPPLFSHTLRTLWTNPPARERIAGVACLELENWDGSGADSTRPDRNQLDGHARLVVNLRRFPRAGLSFDLSLPNQAADGSQTLEVETTGGPVSIDFRNAAAGTMRLDDPGSVEVESLLVDELVITGAGGRTFRRRPRRCVPLRYDELQQAFVEAEGAQLGDPTLVLAVQGLSDRVVALLDMAARPGWTQLAAETPGLPEGWCAFRDVQILTRPDGAIHLDLQPLLPRASVSLTLAGGLVLPGLLRKWSSLAPPEVHAVSPGAKSLRVQINRGTRVGSPVFMAEFCSGVALVDLAELDLTDGEYLITVTLDNATRPSASALLRLRSGGTPELRRLTSGLVYRPASGHLWPISAASPGGDDQVDGARIDAHHLDGSDPTAGMPPATARARPTRADARRAPIRVGLGLGIDSCMRTGMHRIVLPPALDGVPLTRSVEGVCNTCGLVKRYPTTSAAAVAKKKRSLTKTSSNRLDLTQVPPIRQLDSASWGPAFDALCHVGRGSAGAVSRVLSQLDGSTLAVDVLVRSLEVLGHVDVQRDPLTLDAAGWEVTPPTLVRLGASRWWLVGARSVENVAGLRDLVAYAGGTTNEAIDQQVPRLEVSLAEEQMREVVDALRDEWRDLQTSEGAAARLAAALPPLSVVAAALPRGPIPGITRIERWDTTSASWIPGGSLEYVGAFRLTHHSRAYVLRDDRDLGDGTVTHANAQLVKHIANSWAKDPLAGYHSPSRSVVVPLGADLPALYGRALVLASGLLPVPQEGARMLQYQAVDPVLAAVLHDRLIL